MTDQTQPGPPGPPKTLTSPNSEADRGTLVVRNVGFNLFGQAWFAVLSVATTPYILLRLGVDTYGLYVLVSIMMSYFSFLDLGLGAALVKYIAEYHAKADSAAVERLIRTGSGLFLIVGAAGAALTVLLAFLLVDHVLDLGSTEESVARAAFCFAAGGFAVNMAAQSFSVVPMALQRFDVVLMRTIGFGTASVLSAVVVLALGYGLLAVLAANLAVTALTAVSFYFKCRSLVPTVSFLPSISRCELRLLLRFGSLRAVQRISTRLVFQLDRLVVGAFAPIAAVAYYAVPLSLSQRVTGLVNNVGTAVFPAASALSGVEDSKRVEELYLRAFKLSAIIAIPSSMILFFYSDQILRYWLSADFEANASGILMILAVANLLFAATTVPATTLDAMGRIRVSTVFGLVAAGVNLVLVFSLVPTVGYQGAAWAVLANASIMAPMLLVYTHSRVLRVGLRELVMGSLVRPFVAALALIPAMIWARQYATSLPLVAVLCALTFFAYLALTVITRTYDARDRAVLNSLVRGPWRRGSSFRRHRGTEA